MRISTVLCGVVLAAGCGGSNGANPPTGNSVTGAINSRAFAAQDAIATNATGKGFSFGGPATYIEITDYANACALETAGQQPTSGQRLVLAIASYDASGRPSPPAAPATFTVQQSSPGGANSKVAELYYDGGCFKAQAHAGLSGAVTVTKIGSDGALEGTFDLIITCDGFSGCTGPDPHLTGSFHATPCAGLNVNATPVCS
jgi:hypothetical protein